MKARSASDTLAPFIRNLTIILPPHQGRVAWIKSARPCTTLTYFEPIFEDTSAKQAFALTCEIEAAWQEP